MRTLLYTFLLALLCSSANADLNRLYFFDWDGNVFQTISKVRVFQKGTDNVIARISEDEMCKAANRVGKGPLADWEVRAPESHVEFRDPDIVLANFERAIEGGRFRGSSFEPFRMALSENPDNVHVVSSASMEPETLYEIIERLRRKELIPAVPPRDQVVTTNSKKIGGKGKGEIIERFIWWQMFWGEEDSKFEVIYSDNSWEFIFDVFGDVFPVAKKHADRLPKISLLFTDSSVGFAGPFNFQILEGKTKVAVEPDLSLGYPADFWNQEIVPESFCKLLIMGNS